MGRVKVIRESDTGRNERFKDTQSGRYMSREQFVAAIKNGSYSKDYYVRKINKVETPCSKPNNSVKDNLG